MIEKYFKQGAALNRLRSGSIGQYLDGFAEHLSASGFSRDAVRRDLRNAAAFGRWLEERSFPVSAVCERVVGEYVGSLERRRDGGQARAAAGLSQLVSFMRRHGLISTPTVPRYCGGERWAEEFDEYLNRCAGFSLGTRANYVYYARLLGRHCFDGQEPEWPLLTPESLIDFVQREAKKLAPSGRRQPVSAVKALLRYLTERGSVNPGLIGAIPPVRSWRHSSLPQHLPAGDVERLLAACDDGTKLGVRDRAVLTVIARMGLRVGEVAALSLDHIDWQDGRVLVQAGKSRRERSLPLSQTVGNAIVSYLRHARPRTDSRALFLRIRAPIAPLTSLGITRIAIRRQVQAGISASRSGGHVLRHTAATELVQRGATFKEIADVLGHEQLATTSLYAKLDAANLASVALPWPGGEP